MKKIFAGRGNWEGSPRPSEINDGKNLHRIASGKLGNAAQPLTAKIHFDRT
jgi:hypothetical protein